MQHFYHVWRYAKTYKECKIFYFKKYNLFIRTIKFWIEPWLVFNW